MSKLFGSKRLLSLKSGSLRRRRRNLQRSTTASLFMEHLEDRRMLATLNFSGGVIDYDGGAAATTLKVELVGSDYRFTDTENITVSGGQAGSTSGTGTMVVLAPTNLVTSIDIDMLGGADAVSLSGLTLTGNLSVTAENVTLNGLVKSNNTITINANGGAITDNNTSDPDIEAVNIVLTAQTGIGKLADANPTLEVNATNLSATTVTGGVSITDTAGGVALGTLSAGAGVISLTAQNGVITDGNGAAVNLTAVDGVNLTTTGVNNGIGSNGDAIETTIGSLTATTNDGGIYIVNTGSVALGAVSAGAAFINLTTLNGGMTDGNGALVNLTAANGVSLTTTGSGSAIGTVSNPIETKIGSLTATTNDGGIFIADSNGPGLIINTVLAKEQGQTPFLNGDQIVVFGPPANPGNPHAGMMDVSISAQGDILLSTVTAPDAVTISSVAGRILDINQASNNVLSRTLTLAASGMVGQDGDAIESTVESFSTTTTNGPIFLSPLNTSTAASIVAGGLDNQVLVTSTSESLRIGTITASGSVTVQNGGGSLLDDNGSAVNITGSIVKLTGTSGIGTALDPLETNADDLSATVSDAVAGITPAASIYIDNSDGGLVAMDSVAAETNAGDVLINFLGGSLSFVASTQLLNAAGAAVTFETKTGDVKLGLVDAGSEDVSITAAGVIADDVNDTVVDLRGGTTKLVAESGIGANLNGIDTDVATLDATTDTGGIYIQEFNAFSISASARVGNIDVRNATGNMTVGLVSSPSDVTLQTSGAMLDGNGVDNNISAATLSLLATNGIGASGDGLETSVNTLTANGGTGGGLLLANSKSLVLTSAGATGGAVSISASGNLTLGPVTATGQAVTLRANGALIDGNGNTTNVNALSATMTAAMIGTSSDKIETDVSTVIADSTSGGIFLSNVSLSSLTLTASALGQAADIDINTAGSIVLNTAIAQGDTVKLRATGSITDGNDSPPPIQVNIVAKSLDIAAPGGIGTLANPLEADVASVALADGGTIGASITFTGPLLLTEAALQAAGSGTLTFDAESITIENIADNTASVASGRSLVLRTPTGAIVFLDTADTIETSGAGSITIQAGTVVGSGAVGVLGNLKTAGGNILVAADRTITIGLLNAGTGDVTVQSHAGIIVDGNGTAINVIAGTTTLSGASPTARQAELDEEFGISNAAAFGAQAASEQTTADAFQSQLAIINVDLQTLENTVATDEINMIALDNAYNAATDRLNGMNVDIATGNTIVSAASLAASISLIIMGPAQAVPLVGDAGAATVWAALQIALQVASVALNVATVEANEYAFTVTKVGNDDVVANAKFFASSSSLDLAKSLQSSLKESNSIALAAAARSAIVRDASERIRDQAILARDQANVIGTFTSPLGLDVAGVINVTAGATDSYLEVVDDTAIALIQTTGSVTLISTGTITDADAGAGADILATGLKIVAEGGIGTTADPIETRVGSLNATNTISGNIVISNVAGAPAALDITGISNSGGGNVLISNQGSTASGEGITVSGPISAVGGTASVTINSGSPLTIDSDIIGAGAITLTAAETLGGGDDLSVNSGVTIQSTGSSVTLRAGDNITVSAGSTIQASTGIIITADFNDDAADTTGANVIVAGTLIAPLASIGVDPAANDNDTFTITPQIATPITVDAEDGSDTLNFNADGLAVTIVGNQITAAGRQAVTFNNFEFVNIINASGGGSITVLAEAGDADALTLTGTGQKAGTFTLNGGVPISFSGVDSFLFNAGDLADVITVTPFATSVLPWNVAVAIDGGTGADQIIYNNVIGLLDSTSVTATAPQAGHIDSPGVTSALNSQLVSFTNVEAITANANPGEDETLTVNQRNTSAPDTTILLNDDLELVGLFSIDTENYVGLTLNGRGGDDTFEVTPGTIPVFIDGGNPIGATAGDMIRFLPTTDYTIEPGPENDSGGFVAGGLGSNRISWDHIEQVSISGGGAGVFLGTNGDDDITVIARDSSTHAGADGVRDFTVSLNDGPSVLFLNTPIFSVEALAGDDDIVLRTLNPNIAVWDVQLNVKGGTPEATTGVGQQGDVFELETQGVQTVTYSSTGIGIAELSTLIQFSEVEQVVYRGQGENQLTMNGSVGDDYFVINPASGGSGSHRANLSPMFDFTGANAVTANGGSSGTDKVTVEGTDGNDVFTASAATRLVTVKGPTGVALSPVVLGTGIDIVTIQAKAGDDRILVSPDPTGGAALQFNVNGDLPNASDRLVVEDQGIGNTIQHYLGPDQRSGSIIVGSLPPVSYEGIEYVDITPLNADGSSNTFGGTGSDGLGRIVVFHPDIFSSNNSFHNPTEMSDLAQYTAKPSISPGAQTDPFGTGVDLHGDEDWYRFTATKTGTFQFKALFDTVSTLANGQPGLPGDGQLRVDMFNANGTPIVRLPSQTDVAVQTIGVEKGMSYLVRVQGATPNAINIYDLDVADLDTLGPQIVDPDGAGPQQAIQITGNPTYNIFDVKPIIQGPTPLVNSLTINIQDQPSRFPGFVYGALDTAIASAAGHYKLVGDHNGIIAISEIVVINAPVVEGGQAIATIELRFASPLLDDRYTLTLNDSIADPSGNKLDGESNAQEPQGGPTLPSGDGVAGGDFVARFTVDSRAELGVYSKGSVYIDTNGNNLFDPEAIGSDHTNGDIVYKLGNQTSLTIAGNFAPVVAPGGGPIVADGFDKLATFGSFGGSYRWLIDTDNNGVADLVVTTAPQVTGLPFAGNFDGNSVNGDEVGLKSGTTWRLDTNHDFQVDKVLAGNMVGAPFVGDFDGDGIDDLGAWSNDLFVLDLSSDGIDGMTDVSFKFGFPGVREVPFAADFNGDGVDDIGLWQPDGSGVSPEEQSEFYVLMSQVIPKMLLDEAVFAGSANVQTTQPSEMLVADAFIPIDPTKSYVLSGDAMSGDGGGSLYDAANKQYFGFTSYDIDQLKIESWQTMKYGNATDTVLTAALKPGDTKVYLQNAAGWANGGLNDQRSLAWYGYKDSQGHTYGNYTYTRNVATNAANGVWGVGGITGNVITLSQPWTGPLLTAGSAVRNAASGDSFNYAGLANQSVPDAWTAYESTLSGTGNGATQFRPGTAFIKPTLLTNSQGNASNQITWQNIQVQSAASLISVVDRITPTIDGSGGNEIAFTPQPFGPDIFATFGDSFASPVVGNFDPPVVATSSNPVTPVRLQRLVTTNLENRYDVNGDGRVTALDALSIINYLNADLPPAGESTLIEAGSTLFGHALMLNVNGDDFITALDALNVINRINELEGTGLNPEPNASVVAPIVYPSVIQDIKREAEGGLTAVIGEVAEGLIKFSSVDPTNGSQDHVDRVFASWTGEVDENTAFDDVFSSSVNDELLATLER